MTCNDGRSPSVTDGLFVFFFMIFFDFFVVRLEKCAMVKALRSRYRYSRRPPRGQFIKKAAYAAAFGMAGQYLRKRKRSGAALRKGRRVGLRGSVVKRAAVARVRRHGENSSLSSVWIGRRRRGVHKSLYRKLAAPQTAQYVAAGKVASLIGRQGVATFDFLTKGNLDGIKSVVTAGGSDKNVKWFMKTGRLKLTLRNQSNSNCRLTLYDVLPKRLTCSTSIDSPEEAFSKGLSDLSGATISSTSLGVTPFKSPEFRRNFYVHRVTYVNLEPGETHEHVVHFIWDRFIDTVAFENVNSQGIPGFTRFVMAVFHGMLGHESADDAVVTHLPVKLDYSIMREWSYSWMETPAPTVSRVDALPLTITNFDFMGQSDDIDADNVAA